MWLLFCLVSRMRQVSHSQVWVTVSFQNLTQATPLVFQLGRCRSVKEFEKLNRIGEGTYGIVCECLTQGLAAAVLGLEGLHCVIQTRPKLTPKLEFLVWLPQNLHHDLVNTTIRLLMSQCKYVAVEITAQ